MSTNSPSTVLVVDDDANLRRAIESVLSAKGYRVLTAGGAEAAYALLRSQPADAAFVDVRLPDMSGLALYLALISRHPQLEGRIAMITADADADDVRGWLEANHCTVFRKPFGSKAIMGWLEGVLSNRDRKVSGR